VNLEADSYSAGAVSEVKQHVQRFLGIQSSVDGTSEQAIKDWDETFFKKSSGSLITAHLPIALEICFI
jgi:hypothetical protein